uniref:Uncharacterized protein n=1 Tax=Setaria viridis TaxID=4556 RepID=A0A4V6D944_SETVI|nr:hypothetical protein SEVIR_3G047000v2 [Setaria viridis]
MTDVLLDIIRKQRILPPYCEHHHGHSPLIFDLSYLRWILLVGSRRKATKPAGGRFKNKTCSRWTEAFSIQSKSDNPNSSRITNSHHRRL